MDIPTILAIFVAGLLAIGVTAYMLNRAWGDFPSRSGPYSGAPPSTGPARATAPADDDGTPFEKLRPDEALPPGASKEDMIPITNSQVRRAVEAALERAGSPYATYFVRDGERIYLAASRIADPIQRAQVTRLFQGLNGGDMSGVTFSEIISVMQRLGK